MNPEDPRIATIREYITNSAKSVPQGEQEETRAVLDCLLSLEREITSLQTDNDTLSRAVRDGLLAMTHDDLAKLFGEDGVVQSAERVRSVVKNAMNQRVLALTLAKLEDWSSTMMEFGWLAKAPKAIVSEQMLLLIHEIRDAIGAGAGHE